MSADDTWMHPITSLAYTAPPPKNGTYHQIQRKRATPVSGNVSHIYNWDVYAEDTDKDKRDTLLARLRAEHPTWHLRARTLTFVDGRLIGSIDPFEYRDA
jgi:hypothetical protein